MSSWTCKNCGLSNPYSQDKCFACYNHNPALYWQCNQCEFINKINTNQCTACYNNLKASKINNNKWNRSILELSSSKIPINIAYSKLISFNDKLYTMIVSSQDKQIKMFMIDHQDTPNSYPNQPYYAEAPRDCRHLLYQGKYWHFSRNSWCINHQKAELYLVIIAMVNQTRKWTLLLLNYDLNTQKIKRQYRLNIGSKTNPYNIRNIQHISITNNTNTSTKCGNIEQISYNIINHWLRTRIILDNNIPNEVYILINNFYSFSAKTNAVQLLIFRTYNEGTIIRGNPRYNRGYRDYLWSWKLDHGIIDLDKVSINDLEIDIDFVDTKLVKEANKKFKRGDFGHIVSLQIGYEIHMLYDKCTAIFNLQNGELIKLTKSLLPFDESVYNYGTFGQQHFFIAYDQLSNLSSIQNNKYLYFLMQNPHKKQKSPRKRGQIFDVWCFDKMNKRFLKIKNTENNSLMFRDLMQDISISNSAVDMIYHKSELIVSNFIARDGQISVYKLTITDSV